MLDRATGTPREGGLNLHAGALGGQCCGPIGAPLGLHLQGPPHHPSPAVAGGTGLSEGHRLAQHGTLWPEPLPGSLADWALASPHLQPGLHILLVLEGPESCSVSPAALAQTQQPLLRKPRFQLGPSAPPGPMSLRPVL